ncbi:MAG: FkbM family methyltransferase [Desulfovibrio sp.]|nr:FkbM family methyltransferase [Desulfovibrio sp.]
MSSGFAEGDYIMDRIDTWLLESYSLHGICEVEKGDIVLDCGTYSGNTTLYFANKTGSTGHVYGFEPHPEIFTRYSKNVAQLKNCTQIRAAIAATSGTVCFSNEITPGSHIVKNGIEVQSLSLNDFICWNKVNIPPAKAGGFDNS